MTLSSPVRWSLNRPSRQVRALIGRRTVPLVRFWIEPVEGENCPTGVQDRAVD